MTDLLTELRGRLPEQRIKTDPDIVGAYSHDRAHFEEHGTAAVLVSPHSTDEVVAAMKAAEAANAIVVPRGAGTGLTGAANAIDDCMILSLHNMTDIIEIDKTNRMARLQPGVINCDLKAAVAEEGMYYPPDPASFDMSSIGGNVATNAETARLPGAIPTTDSVSQMLKVIDGLTMEDNGRFIDYRGETMPW